MATGFSTMDVPSMDKYANSVEVVNPPTLSDHLIDILQRPMLQNEMILSLKRRGISIVSSGYLKGYLDSLVDNAMLYSERISGNRLVYCSIPMPEHTQRCCSYCGAWIIVYDSDVGSLLTCPKCAEEMKVVLTLGSGVKLEKACKEMAL